MSLRKSRMTWVSLKRRKLLTPTDMHVGRDKMNRRRILSVSATIALGLALFGITAGSTARAAEIKLLCVVALHPAIDVLIPDFEKSSGHKVTIAYGNAGAIADAGDYSKNSFRESVALMALPVLVLGESVHTA
jgi:hypothetical protein